MEERLQCFFCGAQLVSKRTSFNIFKTVVVPLERQASDLIAELLDITLTEGEVHSDIVCKKCFNLVTEFAELESRAAEIRTDMLANYNATREALERENQEGGEEEIVIQEVDEDTTEEDGPEMIMDAEKLNRLVAEAGGASLQDLVIKTNDGSLERPKIIMVKEGRYEEIAWENLIGEEDAEIEELEMTEEDETSVLQVVDNQHVCKLCPSGDGNTPFSVETSNLNLMSLHLKSEHDVKLFPCDVCGEGFKRRANLLRHLETHVQEDGKTFVCDVCQREFTNVRLFRIHKRQHNTQPKAWRCDFCHKKYSSRNLLEEHTNTHLGVKPYTCSSCGKSFSSKYTYRAHLKIHENRERIHSCDTCGKSFMTQQNLFQHIKTHSMAKDFVCDICGKGFGTMRNLEVHSVVHSGIKPFVCKTCGKAFARKAEIRDHERTHTGERPFQCEHCGAQFSQRSNLQSHKRVTHFNDRRYLCNTCGKGFKRRRLLDYHIKAAHTGERPYACTTCDATFVYPEHYKKHMRIHTGVKPYKCEVCDKAFNSRDNRNAHRYVHSDKKPYECLVCGVGFMRKPLLYNHMQQAGHIQDTIVVNQPELSSATEQDGEYELTIVDDKRTLRKKRKVYLTEGSDHVIIQGNDKTLFAKFDDGNIRALTTEDGSRHLVDEEGNLIDLDGNIISLESLEEEDDSTVRAHFNEQGQLVNEDGQLIEEKTLIVDESMLGDGGQLMVKTEGNTVQYVQIEVPEGEDPQAWLNAVKSETEEAS